MNSNHSDAAQSDYHVLNLEDNRIHFPYEMEVRILHDLSGGDYEAAEKKLDAFFSMKDYDKGTMSTNPHKQIEYTAVLSVGIFCRVAIQNGLDSLIAYNKSDYYLQQISESANQNEYYAIIRESLKDYCDAINKHRRQATQSPHIRKCRQYIYQHLTTPFTINDMAKALQINATYLSGIFHKYEGITLHQYIIQERMQAAANMLKYSDYPICEISDRFCFSSQSHFSDIFKKTYGMTPTNYRLQNTPAGF